SIASSDFTATRLSGGVTARGATLQAMQDAQFMIGQAFALYEHAGILMKSAATETGSGRTALVGQAKNLVTQAGQLFDTGYRKVLNLRDAVGAVLHTPQA